MNTKVENLCIALNEILEDLFKYKEIKDNSSLRQNLHSANEDKFEEHLMRFLENNVTILFNNYILVY